MIGIFWLYGTSHAFRYYIEIYCNNLIKKDKKQDIPK